MAECPIENMTAPSTLKRTGNTTPRMRLERMNRKNNSCFSFRFSTLRKSSSICHAKSKPTFTHVMHLSEVSDLSSFHSLEVVLRSDETVDRLHDRGGM